MVYSCTTMLRIPPTPIRWRRVLCVLVALAAGGLAWPALAQDAADQAEELRFVDGLNNLGLPDYAELVLARLGSGPEVKARQLDSSLRRGEFDKVLAIIAAEPDAQGLTGWAMRLNLADGYFVWGKYPEARKIYDEFFAKYPNGPPAELKSFFYESAYKYAQMLTLMGDIPAATKAYRLGFTGTPDRETKRQFQGDLADMLMKTAEAATGAERTKLLAEIDTLADELLWVQDLWFGRAIVLKAHVAMLRGDTDTAMKLVDEYSDQLIQIDEVLKEQSGPEGELMRLSPMAQARYLLGTILLEEARTAVAAGDRKRAEEMLGGKEVAVTGQRPRKLPGAMSHFINVFVRYPSTKWAAEAGAKAEEARLILERDLGRQVRTKIEPEQWLKVEEEQIKGAKAAFNQQQFEEAAEQYLSIVNRFPATVNTVGVLADLASCYFELKDDLHADTVIAYLSERYNRNRNFGTTAGNYVLSFANQYGLRNQPERKDAIYEIYFKNFTQHPLAARLLYGFGDRRLKENDVAGAMGYYQRVVRDHARSPVSFLALSKMAVCYEQQGDFTNQIKTLLAYVDRAEKVKRLNHEYVRVQYRLGSAYQKLGPTFYGAAIKRFQEVETRLTTARDTYQANAAETARNQTLLESAIYHRALCYARAKAEDADSEAALKKTALQALQTLVANHPDSPRAPAALSQAGTLWTVLGDAAEAQKMFSLLKAKYPESDEARNVDFLLGMSLLELGKRAEAVDVFKKMFSDGGQYSDGQILSAGNELLKAKEYEIAVQAFDQLLANAKADERAKIEPSLAGKGRALVALGRFTEGVEVLERLFKEFPRSSFTVDGQYALSRAYSELAATETDADKRAVQFNQAVESLKAVMKYDTTVERRADASLETGRIYELKAQAETQHGTAEKAATYWKDAIAAYQTMILFENVTDAAVRPYLEEAYHRCLRLFLERELWQDLAGDADKYLQAFPSGKFVLDARQWRSRANARLAGEGITAEVPAATP